LHSGSTLSNFRDVGGGFELRNQTRHCKTVCIKRNIYLINYNRMRTQWTIKGNRDAGFSRSCDGGLHRYLRNFRRGVWTPQTTPSVRHWWNYIQIMCRPFWKMLHTCSLCVVVTLYVQFLSKCIFHLRNKLFVGYFHQTGIIIKKSCYDEFYTPTNALLYTIKY